ncbi:Crp/Fnr family transcriptional regulator [Acetobacter sp. DmW_043]|uniref:Crp/Fnr family transcriptional regulator n=1 Tax=Acetobacter sp. DmW_043 TaxID=1670658 RepID=UPI001E30832B|nr:Crp/Fnr family transcriptional regulator [Acetobacter sp. DmW_043]
MASYIHPFTPALQPLSSLTPDVTPQKCMMCQTRQHSVCITASENTPAAFADASQKLSLPPGMTLIEEGSTPLASFNIVSGTIRLFKSLPDGRRQIIGFADAGHFLDLTSSDICNFGAETIDTVEVCRFFHPQLDHLLASHPAFKHQLMNRLTLRLAEAQEQMLLLGRKTAREKISTFLLSRILHQHSTADTTIIPVSLPMNRSDIADYLGLTIETVSRTLSNLRREKIIAVTSHHSINILAPDTLRKLASGQEHG